MTQNPQTHNLKRDDFLNCLGYIIHRLYKIADKIRLVAEWLNDYSDLIEEGENPTRYDINLMIRTLKNLPLDRDVRNYLITILKEMRDMI